MNCKHFDNRLGYTHYCIRYAECQRTGEALCESLLDWERRGEAKPPLVTRTRDTDPVERMSWATRREWLLQLVDRLGEVTSVDVAEATGAIQSTASGWLGKLWRAGLLERIGEATNRQPARYRRVA